jgi:hypothetical protein
MKRVLWIEDDAHFDLTSLTGPIYASMDYNLDVVIDVTSALELIQEEEYDAVIVDIRLVPGTDRRWIDLYNGNTADRQSRLSKLEQQLGIQILYSLFESQLKDTTPAVPLGWEHRPAWIQVERFAVFSVEDEAMLRPFLSKFDPDEKIKYLKKSASLSYDALLKLIQEVINVP